MVLCDIKPYTDFYVKRLVENIINNNINKTSWVTVYIYVLKNHVVNVKQTSRILNHVASILDYQTIILYARDVV